MESTLRTLHTLRTLWLFCLISSTVLSFVRYRFTKKMVADFYEVEERTIERLLEEHGDELKYNGYILSRCKKLK